MELEDRLVRLLGESVHDLPVPVAVMVAEAGRRGRRLRLRRRIAQVAATVTVVAGLACGSALITVRTQPVAPAVDRSADLAGRDILGTLAGLLPPGASLRQYEDAGQQHLDPAAETGLTLAYDGGRGPVDVAVMLYAPGAGDARPDCEVTSQPTGHRTGCSVTDLGQGVQQLTEVYQGSYNIWVTRPAGAGINLLVRHQSPDPATALTLSQWQEIARSPRWAFPSRTDGTQPGTGR